MEGITWVMHKYVMHGFLWYLHEDNYKRSSRRSRRQDPLVKVLTSATFIRAVFGILKKIIK